MDELILKLGVAKLRKLERHPTYFPWLQPEMLVHGNMAKLISEKQFTMMFASSSPTTSSSSTSASSS